LTGEEVSVKGLREVLGEAENSCGGEGGLPDEEMVDGKIYEGEERTQRNRALWDDG